MGNTGGNFKSGVNSVDIELDFEIDKIKGQSELNKFGYYFNKKGECRSLKDEERVGKFPSQQEYEEFGAALERYIFFLLKDQYKMIEYNLGVNDDYNDNKKKKKSSANKDIDPDKLASSRVFFSPNYGDKETLLLLIPGSGAVRAGQWARSICINDNLAAGCMYPFISEAYSRNWGVVLFDPNGRTSSGRIYSDEHVVYVYDKYIENKYLIRNDCAIKNILIVCHSAGGHATTRLLNNKIKYLVPRIRGVAGTDTFFGSPNNKKIQKIYNKYIVNWVTSSEPLGTILSNSIPKRVSAGHNQHAYTSASAMKQIFNYFDAMLRLHNNQSVNANKNKNKNKNKKPVLNNDNDNNDAKNDDNNDNKSNNDNNNDKDQCQDNDKDDSVQQPNNDPKGPPDNDNDDNANNNDNVNNDNTDNNANNDNNDPLKSDPNISTDNMDIDD